MAEPLNMIVQQTDINVSGLALDEWYVGVDDTRGVTGLPEDPPAFTHRMSGLQLVWLLSSSGVGVQSLIVDQTDTVLNIDLTGDISGAEVIQPARAPSGPDLGLMGPVTPANMTRIDGIWTTVTNTPEEIRLQRAAGNTLNQGVLPQADADFTGVIPSFISMLSTPHQTQPRLDFDALEYLLAARANPTAGMTHPPNSELHLVRLDQWIPVTAHGRSTADIGKPVVIYQNGSAPASRVLNTVDSEAVQGSNFIFPTGILKGVPNANTLVLARSGETVRVPIALLQGGELGYNVATNGRWLYWSSGSNVYVPTKPATYSPKLPELLELLFIQYGQGFFLARVPGFGPLTQVA